MTVWEDLPVTPGHAEYLAAHAISPEVAEAAGVRSARTIEELPAEFHRHSDVIAPAIVYRWREVDGTVRHQVNPDRATARVPEDERVEGLPKYLFTRDGAAVFGVVRQLEDARTILIVEGTKQSLTALTYAPSDVSIYAIAGCRMWSKHGLPTSGLEVCAGRRVVILLDADATSNREVFDAGMKLREAAEAEGAIEVLFVRLPGGKGVGLDDVLGAREESRRAAYLANLLAQAKPKLADRKPEAKRKREADEIAEGSPESFFGEGEGLLVKRLSEAIRGTEPAALTQERTVALYRNGVFRINGLGFSGAIAEALGDRFRPAHRSAVEEYTAGMLDRLGFILPVHIDQPLLNVRNGMLDLVTGTLKPHDPSYLSSIQIPVAWDPEAKCPHYEAWLADMIPEQAEDLEEVAATMLDPSRTPSKAVFLFGPSRSGKSTFLRLMVAVAGAENTSAVTLHQLSQNRFAAANVFGKILNSAADLSSAHVEDISIFKMMTGEDMINADRKYGGQFVFTNRALFAFSANELPTVGESSRAYAERVKPFEFGHSFAGRENPAVELAMMAELPGILVRWVRAWQRMNARGYYLPTDERVKKEFETRSDRVRQWVTEACTVWPTLPDGRSVVPGAVVPQHMATPGRELARAFNGWAKESAGSAMGERKVLDRLRTFTDLNVVDGVRRLPNKQPGCFNVTLRRTFEGEAFDAEVRVSQDQVRVSQDQVRVSDPKASPEDPQVNHEIVATGEGSEAFGPTLPSSKNTPKDDRDKKDIESEKNVFFPELTGLKETLTSLTSLTDDQLCSTDCEQLAFPPEAMAPGDEPANSAQAIRDAVGLAPSPEYEKLDLETFTQTGEVDLPAGVIVFDIESGGFDLWPPREDFIRITGWQAGSVIRVTADSAEVAELLRSARLVIGHNIMGFDLLAFALKHGVDLHELAAEGRVIDTMLTEIVVNPPEARTKLGKIMKDYSLDTLGKAKFGEGKVDELPALAKRFGGFDKIPTDSAEYARYCAGDVNVTAKLAKSQPRTDYARREHRVAAIAAQIRMNGFRVDLPLLRERVEAGHLRRAELIERLVQRYGLPLVDAKGRSYKSPHATKEGKLAIERAVRDLGVELARTPKGDDPALGKEAIAELVEAHQGEPEVLELAETISALNGVRSVYDTVDRCRVGDRVHPNITMYQSSGRWSITEPGLTVMGKRGGKYVEREIFAPEDGHVIIAADLSQVDARAVAAWCQDPVYMALFEPGRDSHTEIALAVWGDASRRDDAKVLGHGWNYGMGLGRLAEMVGSDEAAQEFHRSMCERFPGLVEWKRNVAAMADAGEYLDNGFGRRLRTTPGYGWTQGPALLGQSAARDILMEGLLRLPPELRPYLRAVVHDEIVLSIPEDRADEIEAQVIDAMTFEWSPREGYRPIRIEAGLGKRGVNWGAVYAK